MARRSQFDYLKPEVIQLFKQGKGPQDVLKLYADLSKSTVYDWYGQFRNLFRNGADSTAEAGLGMDSPQPERRSHLTVVEGGEDEDALPDLQWVKRKAKGIVRTEKSNAIKIQALNTYLRAVQIEMSKPQEIKAQLQVDFDEMSDEELEKLASGGDVDKVAKAG